MMMMKQTVLLALCLGTASAFTLPSKPFAVVHQREVARTALWMSESQPTKVTAAKGDADCQPEEGEYCAVDPNSGKLIKLTKEEKERIFLDALQSYYATGRQLLPDEEFDLLKEDLQWSGSELVSMNRQEARYMAAMEAYVKGKPILNDQEFDDLKQELKATGSKFAVSLQPKCLIDTGICTVTFQEDKFRSNLLYLPALIILVSTWLGPIFEVVAFTTIRLNPLFFLLVGAYPIYILATFITELVFPQAFIAYGPCPSCEIENRVYFGNILGVEGFDTQAASKCANCKTQYNVQRSTLRASTMPKE